MLSIGKLAAGQERYYEKQVAQGLDDYFTGRGESPGRWLGRGTDALGLAGTVKDGELSMLMEGRDPRSGQLLREQPVKVAALDLTFSAPKSLSVLHSLAGDGVSAEIVGCHEEAVQAALGYLEETALLVSRRTDARLTLRQGGGFVAAAFRHRMSRALDPQLHTHVVAGNIARGLDGRWTALHHPTLFRAAQTAGYLYQAHLRALVRERLGLEWGPVRKGAAELAAIDPEVVDEFSRRRHEILRQAETSGLGLGSRAASQTAALATRSRKQYGIETGTWREEVASRAAEHGLDRERVAAIVRATRDVPRVADSEGPEVELFDRLAGPAGLTELQNTFDERAVLRTVAESAAQGARIEVVRDRGRRFSSRRDVLETSAGEMTTAELTGVERSLVAAAYGRASERAGRVSPDVVQGALAGCGQSLNAGQRRAVEATVGSGHGVQVIEALAGTGKTFTAGVLRHVYQQAGYQVVGVAPTGRAVRELAEQAGIPARTLDSMLYSLQRGYTLPVDGVVVIDEAGMAPTRQTAVLLEAAQQARCKVVAIGDPGQLHSVQAGGWMRAVGRRVGTLRLSEVMRQREPLERQALAALHEGKPQTWLQWARRNERISVGPGTAVLDRAVSEWHTATERHGLAGAVLIARDNSARDALNQRARLAVRQSGMLGDQRCYGAIEVAVGDRVICRRNDHRVDVDNGTRGTVLAVSENGVAITTDAGSARELAAEYVAAHVEHAYALTGHGMQGGTVEMAFVVAAPHELTKGWSYTALSRARDTTRLFVITDAARHKRDEVAPGERAHRVTEPDLYARIARYMRTRDDEDLAIEQLQDTRPAIDQRPAAPRVAVRDDAEANPATRLTEPPSRAGYQEARRAVASIEEQLRSLRSPEIARLAATERRADQLTDHHADLLDRAGELPHAGRPSRRVDQGERANLDRAIEGVQTELSAVRALRHRLVREVGSLEQLVEQRDEWQHALDVAIRRRDQMSAELVTRELRESPAWLTSALGERPTTGEHRRIWDRAAKGLARHRVENDVVDENAALGQRPDDAEQARRYDDAVRRLDEVRLALDTNRRGVQRPTAADQMKSFGPMLGDRRAALLVEAIEPQLRCIQTLGEADLWEVAMGEKHALDQLDRRAAAQTLRLEHEHGHHVTATLRQSVAADKLERHASQLGWRARHDRQRLQHDAALQREHAARHQADADRIALEIERLREAGRHPDLWLDRYGEQLARGVAANAEISFRRQVELERRVQLALLEPPAYVRDLIGDRPVSGVQLASTWERLVELLERLRLSEPLSTDKTLLGLHEDERVGDLLREDSPDGQRLAEGIARFREARGLPEHPLVEDSLCERDRDLNMTRER